jgi:hypothetical protein
MLVWRQHGSNVRSHLKAIGARKSPSSQRWIQAKGNAQALINGGQDPSLHLRRQMPVDRPDGAPTSLPAAGSGGPVAHQLIDYGDRDAGILQPGRAGMT